MDFLSSLWDSNKLDYRYLVRIMHIHRTDLVRMGFLGVSTRLVDLHCSHEDSYRWLCDFPRRTLRSRHNYKGIRTFR